MIIYAMLDLVKNLKKARLVIANFRPYDYGFALLVFIEYMVFTLL